MPKAIEVAAELRKLAEALEKAPEMEIVKPGIYFSHWNSKEKFINLARLLPRPLSKKYVSNDLELDYNSDALRIMATVERNVVCRIVEPAKEAVYECEPLLSEEEEKELEA